MVYSCPLISKSSSSFPNPLGIEIETNHLILLRQPNLVIVNIKENLLNCGFDLSQVFEWQQVSSISRTHLSILAVLNNVVVWIISTRPPNSKFSSPFNSPWVTVPSALITIVIIVTFMFHSFLKFPSKVEVLILLFTFFQFYSVVSRYYYHYYHYFNFYLLF